MSQANQPGAQPSSRGPASPDPAQQRLASQRNPASPGPEPTPTHH
jgi:hypothetical protein